MSAHDRNMRLPVVQIADTEVQKIAYKGDPVVTFAMVDEIHQRADGTASRNFRDNRERFKEGVDFVTLNQPDEIRRLGFTRPQGGTPASVILLTERGYLKLVKPMQDDRAWQVQGEMIDCYFKVKEGSAPLTGPQLMAAALLEADATLRAQAVQIESMKADVAAHERLAKADGSLCFRDSAKSLQVRPMDLTQFMATHRWTYRQSQNGPWLAYQDKISAGYLEHKVTTVDRSDGTEKAVTQCRITAKGLTKLAKLMGVVA